MAAPEGWVNFPLPHGALTSLVDALSNWRQRAGPPIGACMKIISIIIFSLALSLQAQARDATPASGASHKPASALDPHARIPASKWTARKASILDARGKPVGQG